MFVCEVEVGSGHSKEVCEISGTLVGEVFCGEGISTKARQWCEACVWDEVVCREEDVGAIVDYFHTFFIL